MTNTHLNILIAEDDPDDQYLFKSALLECGAPTHIRFVLTGQQLIAELVKAVLLGQEEAATLPDLIIADLKKPFFWFDAVKELRVYSQFRRIPVFLFSIHNSELLRQEALAEGAAGFFAKPYTFHDLKKVLREIVHSAR